MTKSSVLDIESLNHSLELGIWTLGIQQMERLYTFRYKSAPDHYTAQAYVLRCFDDRLWKTFKDFLKAQGYIHIDPASVAGGAKVLASPEKESDRDFILREIEKSIQLHHTEKVLLFTHSDCGAYGGLARFQGSEEEQFSFHRAQLAHAKAEVLKKFPDIQVETYFIDTEGIICVSQ
jgi:hypothetical protein